MSENLFGETGLPVIAPAQPDNEQPQPEQPIVTADQPEQTVIAEQLALVSITDETKLYYTGAGLSLWLLGLPARFLTAGEVRRAGYTPEEVIALGLYSLTAPVQAEG